MARQPFYGSGAGTPIAKMDMQSATAPGRFYANALANFGNTIANSIEKFRAKKEKKQKEDDTYTALKKMGMPEEIAMAGKKDPNVVNSYFQIKNFELKEEAGGRDQQRIDLMERSEHRQEVKDDILRQDKEAEDQFHFDFFNKPVGKDGETLAQTYFPNISPELFPKGNQASGYYKQARKGLMDFQDNTRVIQETFLEEGHTFNDLFSTDQKVRGKALSGWLKSGGTIDQLKAFSSMMPDQMGGAHPLFKEGEAMKVLEGKDGAPSMTAVNPYSSSGSVRYIVHGEGLDGGANPSTTMREGANIQDLYTQAMSPDSSEEDIRKAIDSLEAQMSILDDEFTLPPYRLRMLNNLYEKAGVKKPKKPVY